MKRSNRFFQPLHGFTLIELLVVIAIISLLVSILIPSLIKAKELAQSVVCMTNEKSIGLAINYYVNDHNQMMPLSQYPAYSPQRHWAAPVHPLASYLDVPISIRQMPQDYTYTIPYQQWMMKSILKCPSEPNPPQITEEGSNWYDPPYPDYSANGSCLPDMDYWQYFKNVMKQDWTIDSIPYPSTLVCMADRSWGLYWPHHVYDNIYRQESYYLGERHNRKINILFTDWHVEPKYFDELFLNIDVYYDRSHTWAN